MRHFRPLLLQNINLRLPGLVIHRFRLNRHLPETLRVRRHRHRHHQMILYLSGHGRQLIEEETHSIRPGTALFIPPQNAHAFRDTAARRPLCLVVDFDLRGARNRAPVVRRLSGEVLNDVRTRLGLLTRDANQATLRYAAHVLEILDLLLTATGVAVRQGAPAPQEAPIVHRVRRVLSENESNHLSLADLSRQIGYQPDYLTRLLKQTCGLTLGQLRSQHLLARARTLLRQPGRIHETAERLGFQDQNYFARWFRRQTGMAPSVWKKAGP
ncbi:MAG: AraC family transcriptional regulator [Verrucomicrobiota bacterium]